MLAGVYVCVLCAVSSYDVLAQYKNYYCICCVALLSELKRNEEMHFESTFCDHLLYALLIHYFTSVLWKT